MKSTIKHSLTFCSLAACLVTGVAHAACPSVPTAQRFTISADGSEVTDKRTGLTWARCSVGQTWNGTTCTGTAAVTKKLDEVLKYVRNQTGWRLPNVKELSSLVDRGCYNRPIDTAAFPDMLDDNTEFSYWTATTSGKDPDYILYVNFSDGHVLTSGRGDRGSGSNRAVRLVRSKP